jgi:F-type H+-transporting ATPase subunit delta
MKNTRVAERYAKALFDFAIDEKKLDMVTKDMATVQKIVGMKEVQRVLENPIVSSAKKTDIIKALFDKKISKLSLSYLILIVKKSRQTIIPQIVLAFMDMVKKHKGIVTTILTTAIPVEAQTRKQFINVLKKHTKANEIELDERVDDSLIGGFVLSYNNMQWDASVRRQLNDF